MNPIAHIQAAFSSYLQKTFSINESLLTLAILSLNVDAGKPRIWRSEYQCGNGISQNPKTEPS